MNTAAGALGRQSFFGDLLYLRNGCRPIAPDRAICCAPIRDSQFIII